MTSVRTFTMVVAFVLVAAAVATVDARTFGQVIDDATIATEIKAKLTADKISNVVNVGVKAESGIVTLSGTVDSEERRARAAQIASGVNGVKGIINNVQVRTASATPPAPTGPPQGAQPMVDVTGTVAEVNYAAKTVKLQDGRIVRLGDQALVWTPMSPTALKPGDQVLLRGVEFVGYQPTAPAPQSAGWQMGTVARADPFTNQITLSDGTVLRIASSTNVSQGSQRITLDRIAPGSEIVFRTATSASISGSADGSAFPRPDRTGPFVEATDVRVISTPAPWRR